MSDIVVIESPEYEETRVRLMEHPVLRAMAAHVPAGTDMTSWEFVSAASHYFNAEGGSTFDGPLHIGGPAEAIRRLRGEDVSDGTTKGLV